MTVRRDVSGAEAVAVPASDRADRLPELLPLGGVADGVAERTFRPPEAGRRHLQPRGAEP